MRELEYKGYIGSAEVDTEARVLVGRLLFIRDVIGYSATEVQGLEVAFHEAVDEYLQACLDHGDQPELPCKGSFNVRIDPHLHRSASLLARARNVTLNKLVEQGLELVCSKKVVEHHTHLTVHLRSEQTTGIATAGVPTHWESPNGHRAH